MKLPFNLHVLRLFAPVLLVLGVMGLVTPSSATSLTSNAAPYAVFHLAFGVIGLGCVASRNLGAMRLFNLGFGLIELYQAIASAADLWPRSLFLWTRVDDGLHVVVGLALVAVALGTDRQG
jgi:hypothetical protein